MGDSRHRFLAATSLEDRYGAVMVIIVVEFATGIMVDERKGIRE